MKMNIETVAKKNQFTNRLYYLFFHLLIADAPASLGYGTDGFENQGLFFAPALGDLPDLDLPDILDLPNLPTDLTYMTDLGPGIAPSIQNSVNLPEFTIDEIPDNVNDLLSNPPPPPPSEFIPPPPPTLPVLQTAPAPIFKNEIPEPPVIKEEQSSENFQGMYYVMASTI